MDDESAFRQQVRMAAVQVAGLRPDELSAALAYEVEPFSGIPAAEAELAYTPVVYSDPAVRVFDVAVRRRKSRADKGGGRYLIPIIVVGIIALVIAGIDFVRTYTPKRTEKERHRTGAAASSARRRPQPRQGGAGGGEVRPRATRGGGACAGRCGQGAECVCRRP